VSEQVCLRDLSGSQWVTCFQEKAEVLLGMSVQEVQALLHDDEQFQEVFTKAVGKTYIFRLEARMVNYNVSKDGSCFAYTVGQ
jgi:hypothetical protein